MAFNHCKKTLSLFQYFAVNESGVALTRHMTVSLSEKSALWLNAVRRCQVTQTPPEMSWVWGLYWSDLAAEDTLFSPCARSKSKRLFPDFIHELCNTTRNLPRGQHQEMKHSVQSKGDLTSEINVYSMRVCRAKLLLRGELIAHFCLVATCIVFVHLCFTSSTFPGVCIASSFKYLTVICPASAIHSLTRTLLHAPSR